MTKVLLGIIGILLVAGSVYISFLKNKMKKQGQKYEEEIKKRDRQFSDVLSRLERMETGNKHDDFNASVDILHDLAKKQR